MACPQRILIVGMRYTDADEIRGLLSDYVLQIGTVDVDAAVLDQLRRFQPHLVLLGTFPETFNAFEICKRIKHDSTALVLFLTPMNALEDIERAVEVGTDDFLSMPVNRLELQKRVELLLRLRDCI